MDYSSFEVFPSTRYWHDLYAQDKNKIYYYWRSIMDVDTETFKILDVNTAQDKNYIYYRENTQLYRGLNYWINLWDLIVEKPKNNDLELIIEKLYY